MNKPAGKGAILPAQKPIDMRTIVIGVCLWILAGVPVSGQIAAWDFYGQSQPVTCTATTFHPNLVSESGGNLITRGAGAPASAGVHSFRTTGFQNNGISTSNTDYFQVTLTAAPGFKVSLATLNARFNGTSSFFTSPGVTSQFAYSLNGADFILIGNPLQSTSLTMAQIDLSGIADLQNVYSSVTITLRYYASGQTTTGGWGFYSSPAGTNGFAVGGTVTETTIAPPTLQASEIQFNNVALTSLGVTFTPGNGDKRIVVINTQNTFTTPANGEDPPADPVYNGSGEQVVFNQAGYAVPLINGLTPGTTYWFRVFEYKGAGLLTQFLTTTATGNPAQVTTSSTLLPPVVAQSTVSGITDTSAILGGHVMGDGSSPLTARGTVWSLNTPVTPADHSLAEGGADTGIFSHLRYPLPSGARIFFAAWASNGVGSTLSETGEFYTLSKEPLYHVTDFSIVSPTTVSMHLTWTPVPGVTGGYVILQHPGSDPAAVSPSDATSYLYGSAIGNALVVACTGSLSDNSFTVNGLSPGTEYSFTIFPYQWDGVHAATINYLTAIPVPLATGTTLVPVMATYTWAAFAGGNWNTPSNWLPERVVPALNDYLILTGGNAQTITGVPTQTIGKLLVGNSAAITLQGSGTLTIAGSDGNDLEVQSGSQLNISGSGVVTISLQAGATGVIGGSMTFTQGGHRLLAADTNGLKFHGGGVFKAGSGFSGNPFGTVNLQSVIFQAGSTYIAMAGGNPFGAASPASVVVFEHGSLYRVDAYHVPSFGGRTYGNFEMNYAGTVTVTGTLAVSIDHFTASQGSFYFNVTGDPGHSIKGDIYVSGLATLFFSPASSGTLHLNGAQTQSIFGSGSIISGGNSRIMADNPMGIQCLMDTELNDLTISEGTILEVSPSATLTVEGDLLK